MTARIEVAGELMADPRSTAIGGEPLTARGGGVMKRMTVWLVLFGLCAAAGSVRAHEEGDDLRARTVYDVLAGEAQDIRRVIFEEQMIRADLVSRIVWMEAYLMALDHKFEASWEARYPEKVEALKAEGKWPIPRVPGYSLVELKDMQGLHRGVMATLTRRIADLNRRIESLEAAIQ